MINGHSALDALDRPHHRSLTIVPHPSSSHPRTPRPRIARISLGSLAPQTPTWGGGVAIKELFGIFGSVEVRQERRIFRDIEQCSSVAV